MSNKAATVVALFSLVIAIAAMIVAFSSPGPRGKQGLQGIQGTPGKVGLRGPAGSSAQVKSLEACLPEFVNWVSSFSVNTNSNTNNGAYWLTSAYLDTSHQQISVGCKKVLGFPKAAQP